MTDHSKVLAVIASSDDPDQLRRFMENARRLGAPTVAEAAFRRLVELVPGEEAGTIEYDFWRGILALEEALRQERGKTVRLARTRQKLARAGVVQTLSDLATSRAPAQGFEMLVARGMPEYTAEAVILRHSERFAANVVAAARARLEAAGVEVESLPHR